jgi:hypothetical protein
VIEVLDDGIGARKEQAGVTAIFPAHEKWRSAVLASYLQDLAISIRLTNVMASDDDPISNGCLHRSSPG